MFDRLIKNKSVQKAFLGQFKNLIEKEGIKTIVIEIKDDGEFEPIIFKTPVKVLPIDEYNKIINIIKNELL